MKKLIAILPVLLLFSSCHKQGEFDATGIFEATTVTVSAETAGRILSLDANEGDTLTPGEVFAVVDTTLLSLQHMQLARQRGATQSNSPDINAQLSALRTQIAHQQSECERIRRLLHDGAATAKQKDDADAQLQMLKGQLQAQLSALGKTRSSVSESALALEYQCGQIQEQIARSMLRAPVSGTVITKYAEAGEYANPGKPVVKIADLGNMYLRSYFTASQLADLHLGQEVTVIADFGGDKRYEYPGKIIWIAAESEFTPKSIQTSDTRSNMVYAVKVAVENDGRLKLGQYGEVRL